MIFIVVFFLCVVLYFGFVIQMLCKINECVEEGCRFAEIRFEESEDTPRALYLTGFDIISVFDFGFRFSCQLNVYSGSSIQKMPLEVAVYSWCENSRRKI